MKDRIKKLQRKLRSSNLDAMLVRSRSNVRYLTNFSGTEASVIVTRRKCFILVDFRYYEQATDQTKGVVSIVRVKESLFKVIQGVISDESIKMLGFESRNLSYKFHSDLKKNLKKCKLIPKENIVEDLRIIKDENEIKLIKRAAIITDKSFRHVLGMIKPGIKEIDIAAEIEYKMRSLGADGPAFDTIVASGARSALPHGIATQKVMRAGETVVLDFGACFKGYNSDLTRTVFLGKITSQQKRIYKAVLEAQKASINAIKFNKKSSYIDSIARKVIKKYKWVSYFGHSLGHGVGLDIHEAPRLAKTNKAMLKKGMVVTVEPGIYMKGFMGVRIEDLVMVTGKGVRVISSSPRKLMVL